MRAELERVRAESAGPMRVLLALAEEIEGVKRQAWAQATRIRMLALKETAEAQAHGLRDDELETEASLAEQLAAAEVAPVAVSAASVENAGGGGAPPRVADDIFVGAVEVEVGPLTDFAQLVGFEDAAGGIEATAEIAVTRFAQGRATLAMKLAEPVELLRELEARLPFEFTVRDTRADRLVLDVAG